MVQGNKTSALPEFLGRLIRFGAVGIGLNAILYALYILLTWRFPNPQLVMSALYIVGVALSYLINRSWSYRATEEHKSAAPRYFVTYLIGYFIQLTTLTVLHNGLFVAHPIAQLIAMACTAGYLFLLQHFWVFPLNSQGRAFPVRETLWTIGVVAVAIGLRMAAQWDELTTPSLTLDDLAVVPKITTDSSVIPGSVPVLIVILKSLFGWLDSVESVRLALVVMMGGMAGGVFHLVRILRLPHLVAALIAVLAVVNPVAPSQPVFVNGAHPMIAGAFVVSGYLLAVHAFKSDNWRQVVLFSAATFISFFLAILTSPTSVLCSAAIGLIPFFSNTTWPKFQRVLLGFGLAALPVVFYFVLSSVSSQFEHHYTQSSGLTSFSISAVLQQFDKSWTFIASAYGFSHAWYFAILVIVIAGIGLLTFGIVIGRSKLRFEASFVRATLLTTFLFSAGLFAFAPATVVTLLEDRYLGVAIIFIITAICTFFAYAMVSVGISDKLVSAFLGVCLFMSVVQLERTTRDQYSAAFSIQERLISGLREVQGEWVEGAQILVVTPVMSRFTAGYPHWSTGFVRYATGRQDVFGIVGPDRNMNHYPFLGEYASDAENYGHSSDYWVADANPSQRKVMVGLQKERPLYAYVFDGQTLEPKDVQLNVRDASRQQYFVAPAGQPPKRVDMISMNDGNCPVEPISRSFLSLKYLVSDMPEDERDFELIASSDESSISISNHLPFDLDSEQRSFLRLLWPAKAGDVHLSFSTAGEVDFAQAYSESFPPMPLLWHDVLRADQLKAQELTVSSLGEVWSVLSDEEDQFHMRLLWKSDCFVGIQTHEAPVRMAFVAPPSASQLTLGKGYLSRYWTGSITQLRGTVELEDQARDISIDSFEYVSD